MDKLNELSAHLRATASDVILVDQVPLGDPSKGVIR